MEDRIAPLGSDITDVRELISSLELCHHKANRWIYNICVAIGAGETHKGLGTRSPGQDHPIEQDWQNDCAALSAWCSGHPAEEVDLSIFNVPGSRFFALLGERSPLKEWQVQRVIEKIRSVIHWPRSLEDPGAQYRWILLGGGEYETFYREDCPSHYKEHEDFWRATVQTLIHDTLDGEDAELSLGVAIDMLWPCHWRFVTNLEIVLGAIGGELHPADPFAACGRNITLLHSRERMHALANALGAFAGGRDDEADAEREVLALLGEPTDPKRWLAASLSKTISLQLHPPAELRALSALEGPAWIRE